MLFVVGKVAQRFGLLNDLAFQHLGQVLVADKVEGIPAAALG